MANDSRAMAETPTPAVITPPVPVREKEKTEAISREDGSERYRTSPAPTTEAGGDRDPGQEKPGEENGEYITGVRLLAVMIAVVLAAFLMLLDISIISTVRLAHPGEGARCHKMALF